VTDLRWTGCNEDIGKGTRRKNCAGLRDNGQGAHTLRFPDTIGIADQCQVDKATAYSDLIDPKPIIEGIDGLTQLGRGNAVI